MNPVHFVYVHNTDLGRYLAVSLEGARRMARKMASQSRTVGPVIIQVRPYFQRAVRWS